MPQGNVLAPVIFTISINDLFYHIKRTKLKAYTDYYQMYYSERVPVALEGFLGKGVETANQWFNDNGLIVNETKHEALILADTDRILFSFSSERIYRYIWSLINKYLRFAKR